jgi:hypothetical protein
MTAKISTRRLLLIIKSNPQLIPETILCRTFFATLFDSFRYFDATLLRDLQTATVFQFLTRLHALLAAYAAGASAATAPFFAVDLPPTDLPPTEFIPRFEATLIGHFSRMPAAVRELGKWDPQRRKAMGRFFRRLYACVRYESVNAAVWFVRGLLLRQSVFDGDDFDCLYLSLVNLFLALNSAPGAPPGWFPSAAEILALFVKLLQHSVLVRTVDRVFLHAKGIDPHARVRFSVPDFTFEYCGLSKRIEHKTDGIHFGYREFTRDDQGETLRYVKTLHRNMYLTFRILFPGDENWRQNNLEVVLFTAGRELPEQAVAVIAGVRAPIPTPFPAHLPFLRDHFAPLLSPLYRPENFELRPIAAEIEANELRCLNEGLLYFVLHSLGIGFEPQLQMGSLAYAHRFVSLEAIHADMTLLEDRLPDVDGRVNFILLKLVSLSYVLAILDLHPRNVAVDAALNVRVFDCFLNEMYDTDPPTFLRTTEDIEVFGARWRPFVKLLLRDKTAEMKQFIIDFVENALTHPNYLLFRWIFIEDYAFMDFDAKIDRAVATYLEFLRNSETSGVSRYIAFPFARTGHWVRRSATCIKLRFARLVKRVFVELPATVGPFEAEFLTVRNADSLARWRWAEGAPGLVFSAAPPADGRVSAWSANARVQALFAHVGRWVADGVPVEVRP